MLDLDAYFARIRYDGPRAPTLQTLQAIHALHPAAIPFENLDPLLGRPVSLDLAALQAKMVAGRRGGYCFEHNTLFGAVLEALGFEVAGLAARVMWVKPPDGSDNPRTHMLLKVDLDEGEYLADVGFGGYLLGGPVRLALETEQALPGGAVRLVRKADALVLEAQVAEAWREAYGFSLERQQPVDYLVNNWFTATYPSSLFRHNLLAERLTPALRLSLFNRRMTRRHADGRVEVEPLDSPAALADALVALGLERELDIPGLDLAALWARLPAGAEGR